MREKVLKFWILTIAACLLLNPHAKAFAQDDVKETTQALRAKRLNQADPAEKATFAFYKLGHATPNFDTWVRNTKRFKTTPFAHRINTLKYETNRLKTLFQNYNIQSEPIEIKLPIRIFVTQDGENYTLKFTIKPPAQGTTEYNIQSFGKETLAIIYSNTAILENIHFNTQEYLSNIKQYWFEDIKYDAELALTLRPISADHENKIQLQQKQHWLMATRIEDAKINFFDRFEQENKALWRQKAQNPQETAQ